MRYIDICEVIETSGILKKKDGSNPSAIEIFNYSPTGELFMINEWFDIALMKLEFEGKICQIRTEF